MVAIEIFQGINLGVGVVVLKGLILDNFNFGMVWWCDRTVFNRFYSGRVCSSFNNWICTKSSLRGLVVMQRLIFNYFHFLMMRWSWKDWFWNFLLWESVIGCGRIWWFWKYCFWTTFTLVGSGGFEESWFWKWSSSGGCGGLKSIDFG